MGAGPLAPRVCGSVSRSEQPCAPELQGPSPEQEWGSFSSLWYPYFIAILPAPTAFMLLLASIKDAEPAEEGRELPGLRRLLRMLPCGCAGQQPIEWESPVTQTQSPCSQDGVRWRRLTSLGPLLRALHPPA